MIRWLLSEQIKPNYNHHTTRLRRAMREKGLREVRFRFDFEGTKVVAQD